MHRVAPLALASALAACGGEGGAPAGTPRCAPGEIAWRFGDGAVTRFADPIAYRFVNKIGAADGRLEVNYASARLVLEWKLFLANGDESPAQGLVAPVPDVGGAGNCTGGADYPGTLGLASGGGAGWFHLPDPTGGPDGCGPTPVGRGDLLGCFTAPLDDPR